MNHPELLCATTDCGTVALNGSTHTSVAEQDGVAPNEGAATVTAGARRGEHLVDDGTGH